MRVDPDVRLILYGVGSALSLASLIGFILQARVRQMAATGLVENLNARIKAWCGIVLVGSAAFFTGRTAVIALFATISFLALREFLTVTEVKARDARWGRGRITLLGDAAHPTTPHLGQGACMALEDALVLTECIVKRDMSPMALRRHKCERVLRTSLVTLQSREIGWLSQWERPMRSMSGLTGFSLEAL